jgi:hypothetical protein
MLLCRGGTKALASANVSHFPAWKCLPVRNGGRGVNVTGDKPDSQRERENTCAAAGLDAGLPAESLA